MLWLVYAKKEKDKKKKKRLQSSAKQQHCFSSHDVEWITTFTPSATLTYPSISSSHNSALIFKALLQDTALAGKTRIML